MRSFDYSMSGEAALEEREWGGVAAKAVESSSTN